MARTYRKSRYGNKKRDDREPNEFWYNHDIAPIRRSMNQSHREEDKQYFKKFGETKYKQKPKSRGWTQ
jgi:hypothetical protein